MKIFFSSESFNKVRDGGQCPRCSTLITVSINQIDPPPGERAFILYEKDLKGGEKKGQGGEIAVRRKWEKRGKDKSWRPPLVSSTFKIPDVLCHVTHIDNVLPIAKSGLLTERSGGEGGLDSASGGDRYKYSARDTCLQCVFLGTSEAPAVRMKGTIEVEDMVTLIIKLDRKTIQTWCRFASAVICEEPENTGDTVICFCDIPPQCIYYNSGNDLLTFDADGMHRKISSWKEPEEVTRRKREKEEILMRIKESNSQEKIEERIRKDEEERLISEEKKRQKQLELEEERKKSLQSLASLFVNKHQGNNNNQSDDSSEDEWE